MKDPPLRLRVDDSQTAELFVCRHVVAATLRMMREQDETPGSIIPDVEIGEVGLLAFLEAEIGVALSTLGIEGGERLTLGVLRERQKRETRRTKAQAAKTTKAKAKKKR